MWLCPGIKPHFNDKLTTIMVRTDLQLAMHKNSRYDWDLLVSLPWETFMWLDTWLSKEIPIALIEAGSAACLQKKNVSRKWDWNFGPFNMQSSATTRSQATSMQFPYNLASYQGCLYSGLGIKLYTQSAWTRFNPYYPVGHCQSSVARSMERFWVSRQELPTPRILLVCRYIT